MRDEEFAARALQALDGGASVEELRLLEDELRRSGLRRRDYVALARLQATLAGIWSLPSVPSLGTGKRSASAQGRSHAG